MAESLKQAWADLNLKLIQRTRLLKETLQFHEIANLVYIIKNRRRNILIIKF